MNSPFLKINFLLLFLIILHLFTIYLFEISFFVILLTLSNYLLNNVYLVLIEFNLNKSISPKILSNELKKTTILKRKSFH